MAADRTSWAVKVFGTPAVKGSMKCIGGRGRHQLVNSNPRTKPWQDEIAKAGRRLVETYPDDMPISGPVLAILTITVERAASVKRAWPYARSAGDVDKHARCLLDGLEQGGVLADDAQVVQLQVTKAYPDSPGAKDVLDRPGVLIRLYRI